MHIDYTALILFAIITTFSPGPNNIIAAASALRFGYRKTFPLLAGIWCGFFVVFLLCMIITATLGHLIARFGAVISIAGALYILWLAVHTLFATYEIGNASARPLGFRDGALLQLMNPKVIIFGITLFSTFLAPVARNLLSLVLLPAAFAFLSFSSTTTWAFAGTAIVAATRRPGILRLINTVLALSLVLIAINLSGLCSRF